MSSNAKLMDRVAYQVRVCFRSWKVYPFDWWITPLDGLTRYLADPDVGRLYASAALEEVVTNGEVSAIRSTVYGFQMFHEFPRRPGANKLAAVAPGWRDHIGAAAAAIWDVLRSTWRKADIRLLLVNFNPVRSLPEGVLRLDFEELPGPAGLRALVPTFPSLNSPAYWCIPVAETGAQIHLEVRA